MCFRKYMYGFRKSKEERRKIMSSLGVIMLIVLLVLALGGLPRWGYHRYSYGPSGFLGVVVLVVLVLALSGRL